MGLVRQAMDRVNRVKKERKFDRLRPKKQIVPKKFEYSAIHGHYGGYFVDVPVEEFKAFRKLFGRTFPTKTNIREEEKNGKLHYSIFFDHGTKGSRKLMKMYHEDKKITLVFPRHWD
jgi:hypothetical protein